MVELGFDGKIGVEHPGAMPLCSAGVGRLACSTCHQFRQPMIGLRADHDVDERCAVQDFLCLGLGYASGDRNHKIPAVLDSASTVLPQAAELGKYLFGRLLAD